MEKREAGYVVKKVSELALPVVAELGLELWDVEYKKEGSSWYLRIFIDKEGGVGIEDCENVSRAMDVVLDENDPVSQAYYLEVSSPGLERDLKTNEHLLKYIGSEVIVKLFKVIDGQKSYEGILSEVNDGNISIKINDKTVCFEQATVANVKLSVKF